MAFSEPLSTHVPCGCPGGTEGWPGTSVTWNTVWEIGVQRDASLGVEGGGQSGQLYIPEGSAESWCGDPGPWLMKTLLPLGAEKF